MRSLFQAALLAVAMAFSWPLAAQQAHTCSSYSIIVGSPADKLMQSVDAAKDPNAKIELLEKFTQQHPKSDYVPCANQLLTRNYTDLKQYDKAIAAGKKAVGANYLDVSFLEDLLQAYIASGKGAIEALDVVFKAGPQIAAEIIVPRNLNESDAKYAAAKKRAMERVQSDTDYMVYALFRLLSEVPDPSQKVKLLGQFTQAYPHLGKKQEGRVNYAFAIAYARANQPQKADEYGEKAIAADPNNIEALNLVSYSYAVQRHTNQAKAEEYAKKVLAVIPTMKKPEGISEDAFKSQQNTREGMAHLTLGYLELEKTSHSHHTEPAIKEFQQAAELLKASPEMQGQAYYFLGYAYENLYPANHHAAMIALEHAASIHCSVQARARELLEKVKRAAR